MKTRGVLLPLHPAHHVAPTDKSVANKNKKKTKKKTTPLINRPGPVSVSLLPHTHEGTHLELVWFARTDESLNHQRRVVEMHVFVNEAVDQKQTVWPLLHAPKIVNKARKKPPASKRTRLGTGQPGEALKREHTPLCCPATCIVQYIQCHTPPSKTRAPRPLQPAFLNVSRALSKQKPHVYKLGVFLASKL